MTVLIVTVIIATVVIVTYFRRRKKLDALTTDDMFEGQRFVILAMFFSGLGWTGKLWSNCVFLILRNKEDFSF